MATSARARSAAAETRIGAPSRVAPATAGGREQLVADDVEHDAGHGRAVDLGGDRHAEAGQAVEVVGRAVERVDDPADPAGAGTIRALLAEHAVVGSGAEEALDDQRLGGPVHLGDHVGAGGLRADRRARARPSPSRRSAPASPGHRLGQRQQLVGIGDGRVAGSTHPTATVGSCPTPSAASTCAATPSRAPRREMREAMATAEVGDDGFGDDPTVARLEAAFAELVGKPAAVFVPSGTMANQIALRVLGRPGTVVLCGRRQHVVVREAAPPGANAPAQLVTLDDADGTIDPAEVARWQADAAPGLGRRRPPCSWRTPTARPAGGCGRWSGSRAVADLGLPDPPRRRPPLERGRGLGHHARRAGGRGHDRHRLRVQGPGRARGVGAGRPGRPDRRGPGRAQAPRRRRCARSGSSPPPASWPSTASTGSPTTTRGRSAWPRRRPPAGPARSTRRSWRPTSSGSSCPTPAPVLRHLAAAGVLAVPGSADLDAAS